MLENILAIFSNRESKVIRHLIKDPNRDLLIITVSVVDVILAEV